MRNVAKYFSLAWQLEHIASHRISLSVEFAVLTARFVMPTQRISKRERETGVWKYDVDMSTQTQFQLQFRDSAAAGAAAALQLLQFCMQIALWPTEIGLITNSI